MKPIFNPIYPIYYEIITDAQGKEFSTVFYFENENELEEAKGKITGLVKGEGLEEFLTFDYGKEVRIDRIITINGIPGPAYDEYDAYALACLNCNVPE